MVGGVETDVFVFLRETFSAGFFFGDFGCCGDYTVFGSECEVGAEFGG